MKSKELVFPGPVNQFEIVLRSSTTLSEKKDWCCVEIICSAGNEGVLEKESKKKKSKVVTRRE